MIYPALKENRREHLITGRMAYLIILQSSNIDQRDQLTFIYIGIVILSRFRFSVKHH